MRRVLADARSAWVVDDADLDTLPASACQEVPVGLELQPPKRILWVSTAALPALPSRRELAVRLSAELLAARNLVLVRHGE